VSGEDAYLICMPVVMMDEPTVPSTIQACTRCGSQVWMSEDSARIQERITIVCTPCAQTLSSDSEPRMTAETRQRLRDMGYSDIQIEMALLIADRKMKDGTFF
jgi:DNA-directed RNA polymerase subunit RPC12/RpoP